MIFAFLLFLFGLMLSAFFSGSETGLYRVSRTRLVLDGLSGSAAARGMVWLLNHPSIFVATTLVGNNVANFLTSLAIVMAVTRQLGPGSSAELIGPMMMTPIVFVLGELLPKYLFYHAPYRLISATRPFLLAATVLFAPVASILALLGSGLQMITGQTPFRLRLAMARGELDQVLRDAHAAGILAAGQRILAQNLFDVGNRSANSFAVSVDRMTIVDAATDGTVDLPAARELARRRNHSIVLVRRSDEIVGFLRYVDLWQREPRRGLRTVVHGKTGDRHLSLLLRLYDAASDVAVLADERGDIRSVVTRRQLWQPLINE